MAAKMRERIKKEYEVLKVEFWMGENDITDIRAGGSPVLSFWVSTSLPKGTIERIAKSREVQIAVKGRGGYGTFTITKEWAEQFAKTEEELLERILYWAAKF